jgi:hypothetical protein
MNRNWKIKKKLKKKPIRHKREGAKREFHEKKKQIKINHHQWKLNVRTSSIKINF